MIPTTEPLIVHPPNDHSDFGKNVYSNARLSKEPYLGLIKDIQKRFLHKCFSRPKLKNLRQIAIDEISIGKGQKYLTVVLDLDTGCVVFVGDGNGAEALQPFWRRLRRSRARIEAVAMDMSKAYISAVTEHLPRPRSFLITSM